MKAVGAIAAAHSVIEDFLGWLPFLALRAACRGTVHMETVFRIHGLLRQFAATVPASPALTFFGQASALWNTLIKPIQECQNVTNGAWAPPETRLGRAAERRVVVRYADNVAWQDHGGRSVPAQGLERTFPTEGFEAAVRLLRLHGQVFFYRTILDWQRVGRENVIMISTHHLLCSLLGFEVSLQVRSCNMVAVPRRQTVRIEQPEPLARGPQEP